MSQNLDKNKICELIRKTRQQDLLYLVVNPTDKNSKKSVLAEIEKFISKGSYQVLICRN